ncbi:hypothetical protein AVEN_82517-1 [Araneus ventricosus]|uniref:Uncharacterized protein n=1 Tax=Araneus ventricosus TaxID=182803 RepID=A0A4Y2K5I2_ARAVE|nr:hypothetical protein AVEN_82517-1 [Araneus ventricosus]
MLQHLKLVWMPLVSSQNANDTALGDSHLRRETSGASFRLWSSLLPPVCSIACCRLWSFRSAGIGDRTCPFEFFDVLPRCQRLFALLKVRVT